MAGYGRTNGGMEGRMEWWKEEWKMGRVEWIWKAGLVNEVGEVGR